MNIDKNLLCTLGIHFWNVTRVWIEPYKRYVTMSCNNCQKTESHLENSDVY